MSVCQRIMATMNCTVDSRLRDAHSTEKVSKSQRGEYTTTPVASELLIHCYHRHTPGIVGSESRKMRSNEPGRAKPNTSEFLALAGACDAIF